MNEHKCGRSSDHPAEITKRGGMANAGRANLRGFYRHEGQSECTAPKLIVGDADKFAADLQRYNKRRATYNPGSAARFWIEAHA